ncbi:MAG: hypothetical protein CVT63_06705, partial [Candidatus Anoxymicrobium japonicum]
RKSLRSLAEQSRQTRQGYMLRDRLAVNGYDWWWHSLAATNRDTGEREPFFIEYYITNPGLGGKDPVFGQLPGPSGEKQRPSYGLVKCGKWGAGKAQLHNFYPITEVSADPVKMDVAIGPNTAKETHIKGSVEVSATTASRHPEWMSDAGSMSWDLNVTKRVTFSLGPGASFLFRWLNAFQMFWHVQGMKSEYTGTITYNGVVYDVTPEGSCGYQDKNWGSDFTSPWLWLNCNNWTDEADAPVDASLDIGGGQPMLFGRPLVGKKLLGALWRQGKMYVFSFDRVFLQSQKWQCREDDTHLHWDIEMKNAMYAMRVDFRCPKEKMILVNYENPKGEKNHNRLWNGGHAEGALSLKNRWTGKEVVRLKGTLGGCEYGVADQIET